MANFAKLINGYPHYAPSSILLGDRRIFNPAPEQLQEAGYLPVVTSEPPQTDAQHYPESSWEQTGGEIRQVWTVKELPPEPLDPEQRIADLEAELRATKILLGLEA